MKIGVFITFCVGVFLAGTVCPAPAAPESPWKIQVAPGRSAALADVRIVASEDQLVVSGKLRKLHEFKLPGHVDIEICSPDGSGVSALGRVAGYASRRGGLKTARFHARISATRASGTLVRLAYHAPGGDPQHNFRCSI